MTLQESRAAMLHFSENYTKAREQHPQLPPLEELDSEFDTLELVGREKIFPRSVLRYARWQMMQGVNAWAGYLHGFILPNPQNAASMEEYNFLTDKDKQVLVDTLNWIMYRNREMNLIQLNEDDGKSVDFITETLAEWKERKGTIQKLLERNRDAWKAKLKK
jgi:hypothetical protein